MKIHITAVIDSPLTKEEHEETLRSMGMTSEDFRNGLYSEIRDGIRNGYCSENEGVWVKNVQIGW